jgi:Flp pilus assembly protein TadG
MMRTFMNGIARLLLAAWRDRAGSAVVEFAIYAPMLVFGCMATVDVGRAVYERMSLAEILRVGAESAMANAEPAVIRQHMAATAQGEFVIASESTTDTTISTSTDALTLTARRYCACPESPATELESCSSICANSAPPSVFLRLEATKTFKGTILPSMSLASRNDVQVR